jgi:hypothetical protein
MSQQITTKKFVRRGKRGADLLRLSMQSLQDTRAFAVEWFRGGSRIDLQRIHQSSTQVKSQTTDTQSSLQMDAPNSGANSAPNGQAVCTALNTSPRH